MDQLYIPLIDWISRGFRHSKVICFSILTWDYSRHGNIPINNKKKFILDWHWQFYWSWVTTFVFNFIQRKFEFGFDFKWVWTLNRLQVTRATWVHWFQYPHHDLKMSKSKFLIKPFLSTVISNSNPWLAKWFLFMTVTVLQISPTKKNSRPEN